MVQGVVLRLRDYVLLLTNKNPLSQCSFGSSVASLPCSCCFSLASTWLTLFLSIRKYKQKKKSTLFFSSVLKIATLMFGNTYRADRVWAGLNVSGCWIRCFAQRATTGSSDSRLATVYFLKWSALHGALRLYESAAALYPRYTEMTAWTERSWVRMRYERNACAIQRKLQQCRLEVYCCNFVK